MTPSLDLDLRCCPVTVINQRETLPTKANVTSYWIGNLPSGVLWETTGCCNKPYRPFLLWRAGSRLLKMVTVREQATGCDLGSPSGKEAALLRLPPLRTGRVPLKTSGSSTSRTTRLLFLFLLGSLSNCALICQQFTVVVLLAVVYCSLGLRMDVLMTEQMNQCQVAVAILASLGPGQKMMNLKFFVIEEGFSTFWAAALLPLGKLLFGERQVFG
jgi:hypothetical protein